MARAPVHPTGRERTFPDDEIIVSKTDTRGRLTYVNDIFLAISSYSETELLGQPHSIIRHPCMPRSVFRLLWDTIAAGREMFAYINNLSKNGDHYWVFAHVTPDFGPQGEIVGYHSNRRVPRREAIARVMPMYEKLVQEEQSHGDSKQGLDAASHTLTELLKREGKPYEQFVLNL